MLRIGTAFLFPFIKIGMFLLALLILYFDLKAKKIKEL